MGCGIILLLITLVHRLHIMLFFIYQSLVSVARHTQDWFVLSEAWLVVMIAVCGTMRLNMIGDT